MSNTWQKAYSELKEYIAGNPKVEIGKDVIAIPGNVRPEFYRLFDTVREAFLKNKFQTLLDEAAPLSKNYAEVSQEVTKSLGLTEIKVSASLNWFLNSPVNGLIRSLFNPLFDLLKGKIDADTFEHEASINIENSFSKLFKSGYEKWVSLSLINLLAPDKALTVPLQDIWAVPDEVSISRGISEEPVPEPEATKSLSLEHAMEALFIVPDIIVHSAKLGRYVSIRSDLAETMWIAKRVSSNKEWYRFPELTGEYTKVAHWADLFIYIDDKPEELALVADFGRFCRPDIIVKCMEQADWYQRGGLERVKLNHDLLKPTLGSYVVCLEPVPEAASKELELKFMPREKTLAEGIAPQLTPLAQPVVDGAVQQPTSTDETPALIAAAPPPFPKLPLDIHLLSVGYDAERLQPILEGLLKARNQDEREPR